MRPVPKSAVMKVGVITVMLIEFIAAMPLGTGSRARAAMTKFEKAKKTPPTTPEPIAATKVRVGRSFIISGAPDAGFCSIPKYE